MRYPYNKVREGIIQVSTINGHIFKFLFLVKDVIRYGLNVIAQFIVSLIDHNILII